MTQKLPKPDKDEDWIKQSFLKGVSITWLQIFLVKKILPLVVAFSITAAPVLAWDEGGCSFSTKNKASQESIMEQVDNADSFKKNNCL